MLIAKCSIFAVKERAVLIIISLVMTQTSMTVRMDNKQKAKFDELCEQFGMSANTAINIFVRTVIRTKSIPFAIQLNKNTFETEKALKAYEQMRAAAENVLTPELSLDEINDEIRAVRKLKRDGDGVCSY